MDYPYADFIYITVLLPEEKYITQTGNESAMYAANDAKKGEDKQIKEYIDKNILKENDMINVFSVLDMKESFQRYISKYYMIGSFLVVILAFIGIMNFFNTTATSVISRKKELALLDVMGMTKSRYRKCWWLRVPIFGRHIYAYSIVSYVWSKVDFSKYARYGIFLPAAPNDSAMCAYDSDFGWDCVCDTKVSV